MVADVPLGTLCSGGVDSSLLTALASRKASQPVNTYSVSFDDPGFDESGFAQLAASACGSVHHEVRVTESEYAEALPRLIWHHDLPLNFANSVHIFAVSRLARNDVTVVLTGEGADELFGGYPRYLIARLVEALASVPRTLRQGLGVILRGLPDHRARKLGAFADADLIDAILFNNSVSDPRDVRAVLARPEFEQLSHRRSLATAELNGAADALSAVSGVDFSTYLVSILDRQDKMSMATSIESRVPFLDNEVIDFALSLPSAYKQVLGSRKRVLRALARRYLPSRIVDRRKSGFGVPIAGWFAGAGPMAQMLRESIDSHELSDLLDVGVLSAYSQEHKARKADYSDILWAALNLHLWRRAFDA
jgi:asparagine synthase (glutamine-hydrolysing)